MKRVKVIMNPYSDRGGGGKARQRVEEILNAAQVEVVFAPTEGPGDGIKLAAAARDEGFDIVAAAGGDGTINEVLNGLAQSTPEGEPVGPLAVLPLGSGNDFADMLSIPRDLSAAVQAIVDGKTRAIDLGVAEIWHGGKMTRRYFDNNLGAGMEARVTIESEKIERLRGFAIYVWAVIKTLRSIEQPRCQVSWTDERGETHHVDQTALLVTLGNTRRTGGGFFLTPDAKVDDGLFDMGIAKELSRVQVLALLPRLLNGSHRNHSAIRLVRCRSVCVAAHQPIPVHTDGEVIDAAVDRFSAEIEPGRLHIIVPSK